MKVDVYYILSGLSKIRKKKSNQDFTKAVNLKNPTFFSFHNILVESFAVAAVSWNALEILTCNC